MKNLLVIILITLFAASCGPKFKGVPDLGLTFSEPDLKRLPDLDPAFEEVLEAHGDWEKFYHAKAMSYQMIHETNLTKETHFINLDTRKIRIDADNFQIGFDGEQAWISPSRDSFGGRSVRFYHNLYFYFYSIPFVFTDPGVNVTKVADRTINGKSYTTFAANFADNKGYSPEDQYFMLINPETNRIEYLLYTVTFFNNPNPQLSALKYDDYRNSGGVFFPRFLTGYELENGETKGVRYQVSFADILLLENAFEDSIFEKPENGVFAD